MDFAVAGWLHTGYGLTFTRDMFPSYDDDIAGPYGRQSHHHFSQQRRRSRYARPATVGGRVAGIKSGKRGVYGAVNDGLQLRQRVTGTYVKYQCDYFM
jgi:hypothetical protein